MEGLGVLVRLVGLIGVVVSIVALIRPILRLGLGTRRRAGLALLASLVLLFGVGSLLPKTPEPPSSPVAETDGPGVATTAPVSLGPTPLGVAVQVGDAQTKIEHVETRQQVGIQYALESASEGGVLVVVQSATTNIGSKPLKAYRIPRVILIDPQGVEYSPDAGKTGSYRLERRDLDTKLWSDLNPGITVRDAEVFEIAADKFDLSTWHVSIKGTNRMISMQ